ncbi:MAG TPA: formate dehydrogenase accessory sulfurtransferase FdhD [Vicinamibacterales bacterium]|jgi:FdhD protein
MARDREPPLPESLTSVRQVTVVRADPHGRIVTKDAAAAEEPLDVRLHGRSFAVIMRTPGDDRALAAGFLFAERIIRRPDDIGAVEHCRHPDRSEAHHVVDVFIAGERAQDVDRHLDERRRVVANSSCGVCGRASIAELRAELTPLTAAWTVRPATISALPDALRARQSRFDETGGLHAAGLFDLDGTCRLSCEDVGRHNAVDKAVGYMLLEDRVPLGDAILMLSGRVSFEIVQKAWTAGIPVVAAVSAPTSLAIDLAREAGITLLAFVRGQSFNIYTHEHRIEALQSAE